VASTGSTAAARADHRDHPRAASTIGHGCARGRSRRDTRGVRASSWRPAERSPRRREERAARRAARSANATTSSPVVSHISGGPGVQTLAPTRIKTLPTDGEVMTNQQHIELKNREHTNWSSAAPAWKKYDSATVRAFTPVSERMLAAASIGAGQRV